MGLLLVIRILLLVDSMWSVVLWISMFFVSVVSSIFSDMRGLYTVTVVISFYFLDSEELFVVVLSMSASGTRISSSGVAV